MAKRAHGLGLCSEESCHQTEKCDPSFLLSTDGATYGVLCLVQEKYVALEKLFKRVQGRTTNMIKGLEQLSHDNRLVKPGLISLEKTSEGYGQISAGIL